MLPPWPKGGMFVHMILFSTLYDTCSMNKFFILFSCLLQGSGTCMILRDTLSGSVITSTMMRILFPL